MQKKTPTKKRTSYHHGNLRGALVEASLKLIAKEGVGALTLRAVAKMADVSHAAPYAHFSDKDDLIAAIKEEGFRILRGRIEAVVGHGEPQLPGIAEAYVKFALEHTAMFQVMFRNPLSTDRIKPEYAFVKHGKEIFEMLVEIVARQVPAAQAREAALKAWALIHGLVSLRIDGPLNHILTDIDRPHKFEALARQVMQDFHPRPA